MYKNYKELKVWEKSYQLCLDLYKITGGFPKDEKYGLTSQIRKTAMSVPSNIADGYGRRITEDYIRSLCIAYGLNCELETQIMLSGDLNYTDNNEMNGILDKTNEIGRMLKALIKALEGKNVSS